MDPDWGVVQIAEAVLKQTVLGCPTRKKHWIRAIVEVIIPIILFLLVQTAVVNSKLQLQENKENKAYKPKSEDSLKSHNPNFFVRYTPLNQLTRALMRETSVCLGITDDRVVGSRDENAMLRKFYQDRDHGKISDRIGVIFEDLECDGWPKNYKYTLKVANFSLLQSFRFYDVSGNDERATYQFSSDFIALQLCLDRAFITKIQPRDPKFSFNVTIQQMPLPPYTRMMNNLHDYLGMTVDIANWTFFIVLTIEIIFVLDEKYSGIDVFMTTNGVKNYWNLFSWLASAAVFSVFYLIPTILILKYFQTSVNVPLITHRNVFIVWMALFFHICHLITFGYHISSYIWTPHFKMFGSMVVIVLTNYIKNVFLGSNSPQLLSYVGIVFPGCELKSIFSQIFAPENKLGGVQLRNFFTIRSNGAPPEESLGIAMSFSILGILLHAFMIIYINSVRPGKYGTNRSLLYPFHVCKLFLWKLCHKVTDEGQPPSNDIEMVPPGTVEPGVRILELSKMYTTDFLRRVKVQVLDRVSIDFHKNEITALIGHNGAGKTTIMSILSGLTGPTSGDVIIDGKNIQYHPDAISKNIRFCPQEDFLFPELTVLQHLMFFGALTGSKDKTKSLLEQEVNTLLERINLTDKKLSVPSELSSGQRRKLCFAIAVLGDGNVLILDDATSGMDPESKRAIWDILLKMRGEKTIIISSHDMEEVDLLADRVAIIHSGKLKCYGTPNFLKKQYGSNQVDIILSVRSWCNVTKIIQAIDPTAHVLSDGHGQIMITTTVNDSLPPTLNKLDASKKKLGIIGISTLKRSLEEVFLAITSEETEKLVSNRRIGALKRINVTVSQAFIALFIKKFKIVRKNSLIRYITLLLPCLAGGFFYLACKPSTNKAVQLSLAAYTDPLVLIYTEKNDTLGTMYNSTIDKYYGHGTFTPSKKCLTVALLEKADENFTFFREKVIIAGEFIRSNNEQKWVNAKGYYSGFAILSVPITINCVMNALLKELTDNSHSIEVAVDTIPDVDVDSGLRNYLMQWISHLITAILVIALTLYVVQPLQELRSGMSQLQMMTGPSKLTYWSSMYCFDFIYYTVSISIFILLLYIIDCAIGIKLFRNREITITFELFMLFGLSYLPCIYLISTWKKSVHATIAILFIGPVIIGIISTILGYCETIYLEDDAWKLFRKIMRNAFLTFPHISFNHGLSLFFKVIAKNVRCRRMPEYLAEQCFEEMQKLNNNRSNDECCAPKCLGSFCCSDSSYFGIVDDGPSNLNLQMYMTILGVSCLVFWGVLFIIENRYCKKLAAKLRENQKQSANAVSPDEMVLQENAAIAKDISMLKNGEDIDKSNVFLVHKLEKRFKNLQALDRVSFRVQKGECFGLLGVNGAGKSTSFGILTGREISDHGKAYLSNHNIATDGVGYFSQMGYCPQQDTIIESLNAWDHLYLFARLRGIESNKIDSTVKKWIERLNLTACAAQPSSTYNSGDKRRLNVAMALIGNPILLLIDRPTTRVDSATRKSLWHTIKLCQDSGQSIILTSHNMEECEVLCNRLTIMIKGQLVCMGAVEELKERFGNGYYIHIKLSPNRRESDVETIKRSIQPSLACELYDENIVLLCYYVPDVSWATMHSIMNELINEHDCIEDFIVLSPTLEQLFIRFVRADNQSK